MLHDTCHDININLLFGEHNREKSFYSRCNADETINFRQPYWDGNWMCVCKKSFQELKLRLIWRFIGEWVGLFADRLLNRKM
jgi:hypothetical protein